MKLGKIGIIAILMAALLALAGTGALAEATLRAQGTGVVEVDADCATITMGVREVAAEVMDAQTAVNEKVNAVLAALADMGIEGCTVSTNGIGIDPNYDYTEDERIVGYNAYNTISVTLREVDRVGEVIDAGFAAGVNSLDYVEYSATDTAEAKEKALALAVESAKAKAKVLAEAAGVQLGGILEIRDGVDNGWDYNGAAYAKSEAAADAGAGTTVLASRQRVTANVAIVYEIAE